jgi:RimJ/RimL family protein N-acetyltransferase
MWREDAETLTALSGLTWPPGAPPTLAEHLPLIGDRLRGGDDPAWWIWSIAPAESDVAMGAAGYSGPPDEHGLVWVGYALYPEHRGSGFATEAVEALVDRAFAHPEVSAVLATIAPGNRESRALAARVGMRFHSQNADTALYRLTRGQRGMDR